MKMASSEQSSNCLYFLLFIASSTASFSVSAIWNESSILRDKLPEKDSVFYCLFIIFNLSLIVAAIYLLIIIRWKYIPKSFHLLICLAAISISLTIFGFSWSHSVNIFSQPVSIWCWLFISVIFFSASTFTSAACLFCRRLRASNTITAILGGEWFGYLCGYLLVVSQRKERECENNNVTSDLPLNFRVDIFSFLSASITLFGGLALIAATNLDVFKKYYYHVQSYDNNRIILDDDTIRHTLQPMVAQAQPINGNKNNRKNNNQLKSDNTNTVLLTLIAFWSKFVTGGSLSPLLAGSSCPKKQFSKTFILGISSVSSTCFMAMLLIRLMPPKAKLASYIALPCLASILLAYFVALAAFSSTSSFDSPLFTSKGETLTSIAWATVACLLEYGCGGVFAYCRQYNLCKEMHLVLFASIFGRFIGSFTIFEELTVCRLYRRSDTKC